MSKNDANKISEYLKKYDNLFTHFGNNEKEFQVHTQGEILQIDSGILNLIDHYGFMVHDFVKKSYVGPFKNFDLSKTHIARFEEGPGMHEHFDSSRPNDIATILYLNSDYLGGEIYFPKYQISIKPNPGDLLCFPDTVDFVHGVRPITSGIRYTAPRWFTRIV